MASDFTTFAFAIKDRYTQFKLENLTYADRPLLGMLPKDENFMGDGTHIPMITRNPQGIAGDSIATAQTNASNLGGEKFILTAGDYQGSVSMSDKVIKASRANPGAFLQNKAAEIDGLIEQMADNLATYCYGNGGGSIGVIASVSTNDITLTEPTQTINFEVNQVLVLSADDGSDSGDSLRAGSATVTAVDRENGVVTVDNFAGITGGTAGDFIFRQGDFAGDTSTQILTGLGGFIWPDDSPPALYGMTRTSDPQRLAGCRVPSGDIAGRSIEERIQLLGAYMTGRYKGPGADMAFANPEDWQNLSIALQSSGFRRLEDKDTKFGYMALEGAIGGKMVKIYPDRFCPRGTFFALRMKNWKLHSMGKLIHPMEADGLTILRAAAANTYEFRALSYPALVTDAPGYSGRVALAS